MPVQRRIQDTERTEMERLIERLLHEWRAQQQGEGEPLIIEEAPSRNDRTNHLYVIWSDWESLSPVERSKIIMQAYERYRGRDLALSVTLAMGLTPMEARQLNIAF